MSDFLSSPAAFEVLNIRVHGLLFGDAVERIRVRAARQEGGYVCFANVYSVTLSTERPELAAALNGAWLTTTDGMPLLKMGRRLLPDEHLERVYGPDILYEVCKRTAGSSLTHYFYGGKEGVARQMAAKLELRYPGLQVAGAECPSFRELSPEEEADLIKRLKALSPHFIWVGLGTPKQELFMHRLSNALPNTLLLGVGAAFDFVSGEVSQAPAWIRNSGFEWAYRLCVEPRRLWRRYFFYNAKFLWKTAGMRRG